MVLSLKVRLCKYCYVYETSTAVLIPRLWAWQVAEGAKAAGAARIIGVDIDAGKFERGMYILDPRVSWIQ